MKNLSSMYQTSKRGAYGRRATRHLIDGAVAAAWLKSHNVQHQIKFLTSNQRIAFAASKLANV